MPKHDEQWYLVRLEEYVSRYTSKNRAKTLINKLVAEKRALIEGGEATPISVCLEFLTDFIYDSIRKKRRQAIDDMLALCRTAVGIEDLTKQNLYIKDEIFYYFNAKYSRPGFVENVTDERGDAQHQPASMPDDQNDTLPSEKFIDKYLDLVENTDTGEFINNVKHLRGSCMRLLRSYPDEPHLLILKSFSLFVLSASVDSLRQEAVAEFVKGLSNWSQQADGGIIESFSPSEFVDQFSDRLSAHVEFATITVYLTEALEVFYASYYSKWLRNLNDKILAPA